MTREAIRQAHAAHKAAQLTARLAKTQLGVISTIKTRAVLVARGAPEDAQQVERLRALSRELSDASRENYRAQDAAANVANGTFWARHQGRDLYDLSECLQAETREDAFEQILDWAEANPELAGWLSNALGDGQ